MGVPKFYRWVSERYPCLSEVVKEFQIPEFDNLYLDMNGVVHTCSHPDDGNPHFRITEEKIFSDIFHYLEFLFRTIKPKKVFFMAIDGVAPRAKMNQQRGRRFRSARDAEELEKKARESGEILPTEKRFDSNCITPGTEFMVRLQEQLKYFVVSKVSTDPLWQGVNIHLSGHETPGEGEHKIMDFIRYEKSKPSYDHNTRHCLYGLDADLMMLGLSCHEPHFSLLREEVRFGGKNDAKKPSTPEETTFHLLHLSLFREYLDFEFSALKITLPFEYDIERIIDDWILMGFLVGNDFIPHLPNFHINHDALPLIWATYIRVLPHCGGYLHSNGKLNLDRFEVFMAELAKFDFEKFEETYADLKWLEGKTEGKSTKVKHSADMNKIKKRRQEDNQFAALMDGSGVEGHHQVLENDAEGLVLEPLVDVGADSHGATFDEEFRVHKRHYYMTKLEYKHFSDDVLREQAECYIRALQWNLYYYFDGVPSWSWFYPHHYAPYVSDVKDFRNLRLDFDRSQPFLPFQQLMAVLPSNSKELLPQAYWNLMTLDQSEIIDFYPVTFQSDLNGKQQDWEAVVLIPFIVEKRLLGAMRKVEGNMTLEEKKRNCHSPSLCYEYVPDTLAPYASSSPEVFPDIISNHARLTLIPKDEYQLPSKLIRKGILKGTRLDVYFPGFPTFKHLPHKAYLKKEGVKVFTANSRGENTMLSLLHHEDETIEGIANSMLQSSVFVNWPHLVEVKVMSVSDGNTRYKLESTKQGQSPSMVVREDISPSDQGIWRKEVAAIRDRYHDRLGVDVGQTSVSLRVLPLVGRKYICGAHGKIVLEKQFGSYPVTCLYQTCVKDLNVHDSTFSQFNTLDELFPPKESVFMLGWPHYGCQGEVVDIEDDSRVRINVSILEEPVLTTVEDRQEYLGIQYFPAYAVAPRLSITSHFLSRITGCILVTPGSSDNPNDRFKTNIGLNLKFTKRNEEVPGYTKRTEDGWAYSEKALDVVANYLAEFPEVWSYVCSKDNGRGDNFYESELFKEGSPYSLHKMTEFVKQQPCSNVKTMKAGAEILDDGVVSAIEKQVENIIEINKKKQRRVKMQVKPHLLYKPMVAQGSIVPDPSVEFCLFDRIINVRRGYAVPFGLRGTITGVHIDENELNTLYDVVFDEEFPGGISLRCSPGKGYRMPKSGIINLSHGARKNEKKTVKATANQQALNRYHSQSTNQNASIMSYATASQGVRGDNRYTNQGHNNDNRISTKGEKHNQNIRMGQESNWRGPNDFRGGQDGWGSGRNARQDFRGSNSVRPDSNNREDRLSTDGHQEMGQQGRPSGSPNTPQISQPSPQKDLHRKSFNDGGGASSPKFVTPKVSQTGKSTSGRREGSKGQPGKVFQEPHNSDFMSMWQELKSSGSVDKTPSDGTSLSLAATALDQLPKPPVMPLEEAGQVQPLITIETDDEGSKLTVENLFDQVNKVQQHMDNDQFSAMFNSLELSSNSTAAMEDGSIVIRANSKSPAKDAEEGTATIKQLLNIGLQSQGVSEDNTSGEQMESPVPASVRSYGKQLSVQELFEGIMQPAKHTPTDLITVENVPEESSKPNAPVQTEGQTEPASQPPPPPGAYPSSHVPPALVHPYPPPLQVPPPTMLQGHTLQQGVVYNVPQRGSGPQQQVRGHHHGNPHKPGHRNPVLELVNWCKMVRLPEPKYDFVGKPGDFTCVVSLANGQRFQGSRTMTKEEAAESAAGVVLLNMYTVPSQTMHPLMAPRPYGGMPAVMMQHPQFSSPNSAFKPVSPKEFMQFEQPRGSHSYQQHNYGNSQSGRGRQNQSSNYHSDNRYQQQQQQQQHTANHYHDNRGAYQGANLYQDNRMSNQGANQGYHGMSGQRQQQKTSPNQRTDNKICSENNSPPKSNPFIPMQVTRKTPSKRRESESRDSDGHLNESKDVSPKSNAQDSGKIDTRNMARDLFGDQSQNKNQICLPETPVLDANGEFPREVTPAKSPRQNQLPTKSPGQAPKRRSRMAANFSMAK